MPDDPTHLHVISGTDRFRADRALRDVLEGRLVGGRRDLALTRLSARSASPEEVATSLGAASLFGGGRRAVLIEDAEHLGAPEQRTVIAELEAARSAEEPLMVVLRYGGGRKPPRAIRQAADEDERFEALRRREARGWLEGYAREAHDTRLARRTSEAILDRVGHEDGGRLAQELQKLLTLTDGRAPTPEDVAAATGHQAGLSPYTFYDHVGRREYAAARTALAPLLSDPDQSGVRLTVGLSIHLSRLALARTRLDEGQGAGAVAASFDRRWLGEKFARQARGWTLAEIDNALIHLNDADLDLKRGGDEERTLALFLSRALLTPNPALPL